MTDPEGAYWKTAMARRVRQLTMELERTRDIEPEIFAALMESEEIAVLRAWLNPQPLEFDL